MRMSYDLGGNVSDICNQSSSAWTMQLRQMRFVISLIDSTRQSCWCTDAVATAETVSKVNIVREFAWKQNLNTVARKTVADPEFWNKKGAER